MDGAPREPEAPPLLGAQCAPHFVFSLIGFFLYLADVEVDITQDPDHHEHYTLICRWGIVTLRLKIESIVVSHLNGAPWPSRPRYKSTLVEQILLGRAPLPSPSLCSQEEKVRILDARISQAERARAHFIRQQNIE